MDVQVLFFLHAAAEHKGEHKVDDETDGRDDQHQLQVDFFRRNEPADAFDEDACGDNGQRQPIQEGGDDFEAQIAERKPRIRRPGSQIDGNHAEAQSDNVGDHMSRIGEKGQRVRHQAPDNFDDRKEGGQNERNPERLLGPALFFDMMKMMEIVMIILHG